MRICSFKALAVAALLVFGFAGVSLAEEKTMTPLDIPMIKDMEALKIGDPAPEFEAKDISGAKFSFKPVAPGAKLLVFWSIFCEPCREEMPLIQALFQKYKEQGFSVVSVALDGNLDENIRQFVKQGKYTFTVLLDEENKEGSLVVAEKYMVPGTPTVYIINAKGKITYSKVGRTSEAELDKAIADASGK